MITYTQGNLLDAPVEALVNTVNTVGVMGKGIALMFKERFPRNMTAYAQACKQGDVTVGKMFVTETGELLGARWIINFPTKQHWKAASQMQWIEQGLLDLRRVIIDNTIQSIAIPPLGAGNGGLDWHEVKPKIEQALGDLTDVEILVYEPSTQYQNVSKSSGVKTLTPARALIAEMIRRYWILGMECSLLEIQKLAWFLQRAIEQQGLPNQLKLNFEPNRYGPFASNLNHLLNNLDGYYLKAEKRVPDLGSLDVIWFNQEQAETVSAYLHDEGQDYLPALEQATRLIDGFESPFGMELLATVDWIINKTDCEPTVAAVRQQMSQWPSGQKWAQRKLALFDDASISFSLGRLETLA